MKAIILLTYPSLNTRRASWALLMLTLGLTAVVAHFQSGKSKIGAPASLVAAPETGQIKQEQGSIPLSQKIIGLCVGSKKNVLSAQQNLHQWM